MTAQDATTTELEAQRFSLQAAKSAMEVSARVIADAPAMLGLLSKKVQAATELVSAFQHAHKSQGEADADVEELRRNFTAPSSATSAPSEPTEAPLTYAEAFEAIGGDAALAAEAGRSHEIRAQVGAGDFQAAVASWLPRDYRDRRGYSTALVNQDYMPTLEALYARAGRVLPLYRKTIEGVAKATGGTAVVPPVKGELRARMKASFKYRDMQGKIAYYRLTDLVRATVVYADIAAMYKGLGAVVDAFGSDVREFNDRYQTSLGEGYRDLQLVVWFEGLMVELQLSTAAMLRAKQTTGHRDYELARELVASVADGDLGRVRAAFQWGRTNLGSASNVRRVLREEGMTLIHAAARRGAADIVLCFLENNADPNGLDKEGNTPLHHAVEGGHERAVWVLLNRGGASTTIENKAGRSALLTGFLLLRTLPDESTTRAVMTLAHVSGAEQVLKVEDHADEELAKLYKNSRALVDAVADNNLEKARAELRAYADPDSRDAQGYSALGMALTRGKSHAAMANLLRDFRARTPARLRHKGLSVPEVLERGFPVSSFVQSGYSVQELKAGGLNLKQVFCALTDGTTTFGDRGETNLKQVLSLGMLPKDCVDVGFSAQQVVDTAKSMGRTLPAFLDGLVVFVDFRKGKGATDEAGGHEVTLGDEATFDGYGVSSPRHNVAGAHIKHVEWGNGWTVAMWMKLDDTKLNRVNRFFFSVTGGLYCMANYEHKQINTLRLRINSANEVINKGRMPFGRWTHIVMTLGNRVMKLYVNGAEVGSLSNVSNVKKAKQNISIGGDDCPTGCYRSIHAWRRELEEKDVKTLFDLG